jgi:hypothetical protein
MTDESAPAFVSATMSSIEPSTWRDRLRRWLFPRELCDAPEAPWACQGYLSTVVDVRLSWADRIKVLISGRLEVVVKTVTDNEISKAISGSVANVKAPGWLER